MRKFLIVTTTLVVSCHPHVEKHEQVTPASQSAMSVAKSAASDEAGCVPWKQGDCVPENYGHASGLDGGRALLRPTLATYSTLFNPIDGRTKNITIAAGALDGKVLLPGDTFSFNETVGIRSAKNGYALAPVLLEGRRTPDLGGGTCQVSSTLHAAALIARFTIVERRAHSMVPLYIAAGLDATTAFPASCEVPGMPCGKIDLKFKNTFHDMVMLHSTVEPADDGKMRLTIEIQAPNVDVKCQPEFQHQRSGLGMGKRRMIRSMALGPTVAHKVQDAGNGAFVWSSIFWPCEGHQESEVKWFSRYPPIDEIWEVGWKRPAEAGEPWSGQ